MKKLSIFLLSILISFNIFAYEVLDVCATYSNTGKSYFELEIHSTIKMVQKFKN